MTELARIKLMSKTFTLAELKGLKVAAWENKIPTLFWEYAAAEDLQLFLKTKDLIWWRMMMLSIRWARDYYKTHCTKTPR